MEQKDVSLKRAVFEHLDKLESSLEGDAGAKEEARILSLGAAFHLHRAEARPLVKEWESNKTLEKGPVNIVDTVNETEKKRKTDRFPGLQAKKEEEPQDRPDTRYVAPDDQPVEITMPKSMFTAVMETYYQRLHDEGYTTGPKEGKDYKVKDVLNDEPDEPKRKPLVREEEVDDFIETIVQEIVNRKLSMGEIVSGLEIVKVDIIDKMIGLNVEARLAALIDPPYKTLEERYNIKDKKVN